MTTMAPKMGLAAADDMFNFKNAVKEMCAVFPHRTRPQPCSPSADAAEVTATFMTAPFLADSKVSSYNSAHLNMSLWFDDSDPSLAEESEEGDVHGKKTKDASSWPDPPFFTQRAS